MTWRARLEREAVLQRERGHTLLYHVGLAPPVPPEYEVSGLVGLTFRLGRRGDGAPLFATLLDAAAALRLGARLGLDAAESLAMVDAHERLHVALQLEYDDVDAVPAEAEERHVRAADAAWLSLRHPRAERVVEERHAGRLFVALREGLWDAMADVDAERG